MLHDPDEVRAAPRRRPLTDKDRRIIKERLGPLKVANRHEYKVVVNVLVSELGLSAHQIGGYACKRSMSRVSS